MAAIEIDNLLDILQQKENDISVNDDTKEIIKILSAIKISKQQILRSYAQLSELPTSSLINKGNIYYVEAENGLYVSTGAAWLKIESTSLASFNVTSCLPNGNGNLSYDNTTGGFAFTPPDLSSYAVTGALNDFICLTDLTIISGAPSSNGGLTYDNTTGEFIFNPADLSNKLELLDLSVCTNTASGSGNLSYNNTTGEFAFTPADLSSIDVTNAICDFICLTDLSICTNSASGNGNLSYNNTTGEFAFTPADLSSIDVTNAICDFICLTDLSICTNSASGNGNLSYNNTTGEFAFTPADIDSYFTNGNICNLYMTGTLCGPSTLTIDPAAHGDNTGTVVIAGNLQVDGVTTTVNSCTLEVADKNIVLACGSANATTSDGAGITADLGSDGSATLTYSSSNDRWEMNKSLATSVIGNVTGQVSDINNHSTTDLTEGTNLYYTDARADARIAASPGDNQKVFVATGTIATGDVVALRNDGTVELVGALIPSSEASYDSALQPYYSNTNSNSFDSAYDSVNNRIFIATTSDISAQIVISIGTISGSTITFGSGILTGKYANYSSISTIDISGEPRFKIAYDLTTSQIILVLLQENSPNYNLLGYVGNISGNSITWSTSANYQDSVPMHITDLVVLPGKSQVVVNWVRINQNLGTNSWGSDYTNYYYAMIYNIGANSITGGTAKIFGNAQYYLISRNKTVYIPTVSWSTWGTDASIAIFYGDVNPGFYDAQIVDYLLCSVTSVGDIITQVSGTVGPGGNNIARFDENSVAVHYDSISQNLVVAITKAYGTNETIIYASELPRIQTATGFVAGLTLTDITNRTDAVLFTDTTNNLLKFAYSDSDTGTQYVSTITVGVNTGTGIPITQSDIVSLSQTGLSKGMQVNVSNNDYIFTYLGLGSNSTNVGSTVYSLSYTNQNADSWIGIAAENIADTATGLIDLPGAVNRSQTGLTTNSIYYVDSDGSVTTTPTIYGKIGRAYSATELQIFESYKQLNFASHLIFGN